MAVLLVGLAVGGFFGAKLLLEDEAAAMSVTLVAADDPGTDPFTADFTSVTAEQISAARAAGARAVSGGGSSEGPLLQLAVGEGDGPLYGTTTAPVCDVAAMTAALTEDPGAASAWAELMDIDAGRISSTLSGMRPVLLGTDTAVTNSMYRDGRPVRFQAIMQAGTPVLIDGAGMPRVQCSCTNPLFAPEQTAEPEQVELIGDRWDGFDESEVIEIVEPANPPEEIEVHDLDSGEDVTEPLPGTDGPGTEIVELDGYLVDDADGVHVVSEDGTRTTVLDHPVSKVFDDGEGGLIYQHERGTSDYIYSRKRTSNHLPEGDESVPSTSIWRLRSGQTEPEILLESEDPSDHWFSLGDVERNPDGLRLAYGELRGPAVCSEGWCDRYDSWTVGLYDVDSTTKDVVVDDGFDSRSYLVLGDVFVSDRSLPDHWFAEVYDLETGEEGPLCDTRCITLADLVDGERWFGIDTLDGVAAKVCSWSDPVDCREQRLAPDVPTGGDAYGTVVSPERAIVSVVDAAQTPGAARVYDIALDRFGEPGAVTELDTGGRTAVLTAPLVRPAAPDEPGEETTTTTEAQPAVEPAGWDDVKDADIPAICTHPPSTLVDGVDPNVPEGMGFFELQEPDGAVQVVNAPEGPLSAIGASCNGGGVSWPNLIVFFDQEGRYHSSTMLMEGDAADAPEENPADSWWDEWEAVGLDGAARQGLRSFRAEGDVLAVEVVALRYGEPECCASGLALVRIRPTPVGVELISIEPR